MEIFTMELSMHNQINFLDLTTKIRDGGQNYSIFYENHGNYTFL